MTRHQIHLKNIRKMRVLGYELVSDPILMRRLFDTQKFCICPPSRAVLRATYDVGRGAISFKRNDSTSPELHFTTWKSLGQWIHANYEIELVKRAAAGVEVQLNK